MTFRFAHYLVVAGLRWSRERRVCGSTGKQLYFPIYIGNIFFIEHRSCGCAKLHDDKIMNYSAIIGGSERNFLTSRNSKLARLKLEVRHRYINLIAGAACPTRREQQK